MKFFENRRTSNSRKASDINRARQRYEELDAWLQDENIIEKARERGEQNLPASNETQLDDIHRKSLGWINFQAGQYKEEINNELSDHLRVISDLEDGEELDILEGKVETECTDAEVNFNDAVDHGRNALTRLDEAVKESSAELRDFRKRAGLKRVASYSFRAKALQVILGCAMVEILLNAVLLADVNPFGLLGAIAQMTIIAAINILTGWLVVGFALRLQNHVSRVQKAVAWIFIIVPTCLILAFNLLVGHYREDLQNISEDVTNRDFATLGQNVLQSMFQDPFNFSFQSILLIVVGIISFCIASWKGYQSDDPYPGYGQRDRLGHKLKDNYERRWEIEVQKLQTVRDEHIEKLKDEHHKLEIKQHKRREVCTRADCAVEQYPNKMRQYQDELNYLVSAYRDANREARTEPPPPFFNQALTIDGDLLANPPSFEPPSNTRTEGVQQKILEAIKRIREMYEKAKSKYPTLEDITRTNQDDGDQDGEE